MPAPSTGRRSALFDRAHADWQRNLVLPGARHRRRPAPVRDDSVQERHRGASLRGAEVGSTDLIRISAAAHGLVRTPRRGLGHTAGMKITVMNPVKAFTLIALGLAMAAMGIRVADADDAPGAAVIGMLLMVVGVVLGVRAARNRLPRWAARTALAAGVAVAAFAAFLTHGVVVTAPLFPQSQEVPSVVDSAPSPQYTAAIERARQLVRSAVLGQNLPGVSVAVGAG